MKNTLVSSFLLYLLITSFTHTPPVSAEIYKWTDRDGYVHYGDHPTNTAAEKIKIKKAPGHNSGLQQRLEKQRRLLEIYDEDRQEKKINQANAREEKKKREANCVLAKKNLKETRNASFLYEDSGDASKPHILSDQERTRVESRAELYIKQWCD
ncbi:MAG: DUF4124 domain-containing protein [Gammaproteobacteria bacterium]